MFSARDDADGTTQWYGWYIMICKAQDTGISLDPCGRRRQTENNSCNWTACVDIATL